MKFKIGDLIDCFNAIYEIQQKSERKYFISLVSRSPTRKGDLLIFGWCDIEWIDDSANIAYSQN